MVFGSVPSFPVARHQRTSASDDIDFEIKGAEMQFVEIELDPGESAIAEAGNMFFKAPSIDMTTVFGDGSAQSQEGGFFGKLVSAGKRLVTGESLFTTVFTHQGQGKARVAFAAPYPGHILALKLTEVGGVLICQKDSFLCAARGVSLGIHFQQRILTGLFGGEGFVMQRLEGDGWVFFHSGGTLVQRDLAPGEEIHVDTGCVAAYTATVDFDLVRAGSVKSMLFGGEGIFFARLVGPGRVWMQSLPFSRLAGRMLAAAPQTGGSSEEGSLLGGIGRILDGDNR
ncbi:AIM24 family protein [Prosthecomicrobium sp. N25]|uniref:AIM24 family protein n=1 Tax=Prosthecomicrobium sp. N25 TaxID=3129254 RepID=UPI00307698C3